MLAASAPVPRHPLLQSIAPLATIVILLVWMGFFMLGSLPLMILRHDTPLDARFIRGLFDVYYQPVMVAAAAGTLAHVLAHRPVTAIGLMIVGLVALASRRIILGRMDRLRAAMSPTDSAAIRQFRAWHVTGMALNVAQLIAICVGLTFVL